MSILDDLKAKLFPPKYAQPTYGYPTQAIPIVPAAGVPTSGPQGGTPATLVGTVQHARGRFDDSTSSLVGGR